MRINSVVEEILRDHPTTRSNDRELLARVWQRYGLVLKREQYYKFLNVPSAETIRRVRQKIQEEGRYPAAESVRRRRKFKSLQVRQVIPNLNSDKVERLF